MITPIKNIIFFTALLIVACSFTMPKPAAAYFLVPVADSETGYESDDNKLTSDRKSLTAQNRSTIKSFVQNNDPKRNSFLEDLKTMDTDALVNKYSESKIMRVLEVTKGGTHPAVANQVEALLNGDSRRLELSAKAYDVLSQILSADYQNYLDKGIKNEELGKVIDVVIGKMNYQIDENDRVYGGKNDVEEIALRRDILQNLRKHNCNIQGMKKKYQSKCYSCEVVKTLIETFMKASSKVYGTSKKAGTIILLLGTVLMIAVSGMKYVSSFAMVEPADAVNNILTLLFKSLVAYVFINAGIGILVDFAINPLLATGADYGLAITKSVETIASAKPLAETEVVAYDGTGTLISSTVIKKILELNQAVDRFTSANLVIGHALTCHAVTAGATPVLGINFPDIWVWLVGVLIWLFGFMMSLGVSFYLLDISFKIGIAIMLMPLAIAFWPFPMTKGKFTACFGIILKSSALFAFLAITVSYGLVLISQALNDSDELLRRVETGDSAYISGIFAISGSHFILILFAYLYAMKLVESTDKVYASQFFDGGATGGSNPMHQSMTQATDMAKKAGAGAAKKAAKGGKKLAKAGAGKVKSHFAKKQEDDKPKENKEEKNNQEGQNNEENK